MSISWIDVAEAAIDNLDITREHMSAGDNEEIQNSQAASLLANAMRQINLTFQDPDGSRPSWMIGEALGSVESDVVWLGDRGSAGAGIYLKFPISLDDAAYFMHVTSLGVEDQYSNSLGILSEKYSLDAKQIIRAQTEDSSKLRFAGTGFCCAHTLTSANLPISLQEIPGAADYIGETLSQFAGEIAKAFFWKGAEAVLSNPLGIFEGIQHLWLRSIEELELIQFH